MRELPHIICSALQSQLGKGVLFIATYYFAVLAGISFAAGKIEFSSRVLVYAVGVLFSAATSILFLGLVVYYLVILVYYLRTERKSWLLLAVFGPLGWHAFTIASAIQH